MLNKQIFAYKEANPLCIMTNLLFYIPPFPEQFDHKLLPGMDWQAGTPDGKRKPQIDNTQHTHHRIPSDAK